LDLEDEEISSITNPGTDSEESKSAEKQRERSTLDEKLRKQEEDKRSRELLDALLAKEMQAEFEEEEARYREMVDVNKMIETDLRMQQQSK